MYLVRHGQSQSNVEHRLCGMAPGPPLTARGQAQARAAASLLAEAGVRPALALTSPLRRARDTAAPLVRALGVRLSVIEDLREMAFGAWEGRRREELEHLPLYRLWQEDPETYAPPGGERLSEAGERMLAALTAAAEAVGDGALVAYSHHDPMLAFHALATKRPLRPYPELSVPNACILQFAYDGGAWRDLGADRRPSLAVADEDGEAGGTAAVP